MFGILMNIAGALSLAIHVLASAAVAILVLRLAALGLARGYWPVCAYLTVDALEGLLVMQFRRYEVQIWETGEALKVGFAIAVLWELSRRVFRNYPSLGEFAARSSRYVFSACVVLGLAAFLTDPAVPAGRSPHLHLLTGVLRSVDSALLAYVLAIGSFAGWFPVRMSRNVARVLVGMMLLFAVQAVTGLMSNASPTSTQGANLIERILVLMIAASWLFTVNQAGEEEVAPPLPSWNPGQLEIMTRQLDQMQTQLSRRGF